MKPLTKPVIFISALFILMMAAACKKDGDKAVISIQGFKMVDNAGNDFGRYGPDDNDWTFNNTLSDREMGLFNFLPDDVNLNNTAEATISSNGVMAYPNPCSYTQGYHANASDSVLLKLVVVNDKLDVLKKAALKGKGTMNVYIDYWGDSTHFPNGSSRRVYYSFSAQNKPNFKAGYGDIKICRGDRSMNVNACFP